MYTEIIPQIRKDKRLSHIEKLLCIFLIDLGGETKSVHLSLRQIEAETGISIQAVHAAIPRLAEFGYIRAGKGEGTRESYSIYVGDAPPGPKVTRMEHRIAGARIIIMIEEE